jgi:histone H3/H4
VFVRVLRGLWNLRKPAPQLPVLEAPTPAAIADPEAARLTGLLLARQHLTDIFTPARPLSGRSFHSQGGRGGSPFIGREAERERILRTLIEDQAHVLIYGERGLGKTSLANFAVAQAHAAEVVRYVCSADSDFDAIMRGLFHGLPRVFGGPRPVGSGPRHDAVSLLPPHPLRPGDILGPLGSLRGFRLIFLIDEFDRVVSEGARTAIADLIKHCSDRGMPLSFMIIGASDSAEELLGRHPSIQRCVTRVALPLLSDAEVEQIVARGEKAGLNFPASARTCIAELARGVPYMAQLLSLRAGQAALDDGRTTIRGSDLIAAIKAAAVEADPRTQILYDTITRFEGDMAMLGMLRAAAVGTRDEFGRFGVSRDGSSLRVAGVRADPAAWQRALDSGAIRAARGGGLDLYTFSEAMLPQLVLHRAVLAQQEAISSCGPCPA